MIKNLVFDLGGVIIDLNCDNALKAFVELGVECSDGFFNPYLQTGIFLDVEIGRLSAEEFRAALSQMVGKDLSIEQVARAWLSFVAAVDEQKLRLIKDLAKDYSIYLLSNTNPFIIDWADSPALSKDGLPISAYFKKLYCSYRVGLTKPNPAFFEYMINDSHIDPRQSLFIDDCLSNIQTAEKLNFKVYQPGNGENWCAELQELLNQCR